MAENARYQTAQACAGEVLEALYTVYWGDSFDVERLELQLTEVIYFFTRNARRLDESHPYPEELEQGPISPINQCPSAEGVSHVL